MADLLTQGTCSKLQSATPEDVDIFNTEHTVQFLSIKKVGNADPTKPPGPDRYRIIMSDGVHYMQAMLATQLNTMVQDNTIGKNTIAVLEKLTCNYVQEKRLVIILSLRVLTMTVDKIGDPQQIEPSAGEASTSAAASVSVTPAPSTSSSTTVQKQVKPVVAEPPKPPRPGATSGRGNIYPIEGLSPYQNNWTIKARVTQKSEIKVWSNPRGEGKLFNVTLMDDSGEIRGTAFNTVVDELYPMLDEGKVYYISKARVNLAKKKFSNLNNDYELGFERNTVVEECHEVANLPTIKYNFVPLDTLEQFSKEALVDVIAIVKDPGELAHINSAKQNKQLIKRELTLVDKSGFSVRLTLWGKQAEQYNASETTPVIAFKGVKVGDYQGGRTLSVISSSTMQVNPDIEDCFALRGWYDQLGSDQTFKAHSTTTTAGSSSSSFNRAEVRGLDEVKQAGYGTPGNPEYFSARGTIMHVKTEPISYPACPTDGCNKKVEEVNGSWRCEKCDKSYSAPQHRYIMSMAVADYSGQAWLQGFNDVGEAVFGMNANELVSIKENDPNAFAAIMEKSSGNTFNFSCRAKQDTWKDTPRIKYGISRIAALDYKEEAKVLRDLLYSQWAR